MSLVNVSVVKKYDKYIALTLLGGRQAEHPVSYRKLMSIIPSMLLCCWLGERKGNTFKGVNQFHLENAH